MKKQICFFITSTVITLLTCLCSCHDESIPLSPQEAILGKWKEVARGADKDMTLEPSVEILEFLPDGTWRYLSNPIDEQYTYKFDSGYFYYIVAGVDYSKFRYSFSDNKLLLEFVSFADGVYPAILNAPIYFLYEKQK